MKRKANDPDIESSEARKSPTIHHLNLGGNGKNEPGFLDATLSKSHRIYELLCANIALDYYNKRNGSKFKVVEDKPLGSDPDIRSSEICILICFHAEEDSSIKTFFAFMQYTHTRGLTVRTCKVVEGEVNDSLVESDSDEEVKDSANESRRFVSPEYRGLDFDPFEESRRLKNKRIAEFALSHYNNQKGANYELVQDGAMKNSFFDDSYGCWFHICFQAVDNAMSSINHMFFAEVKYNYPSEPIVNSCEKLTEGNTTFACKNCPRVAVAYGVHHPAGEDGVYDGDRANIEEYSDPKNENPCTTPHPDDYWVYFGTNYKKRYIKIDEGNAEKYEDSKKEQEKYVTISSG